MAGTAGAIVPLFLIVAGRARRVAGGDCAEGIYFLIIRGPYVLGVEYISAAHQRMNDNRCIFIRTSEKAEVR